MHRLAWPPDRVGAARLAVVFDSDPLGAPAIHRERACATIGGRHMSRTDTAMLTAVRAEVVIWQALATAVKNLHKLEHRPSFVELAKMAEDWRPSTRDRGCGFLLRRRWLDSE